MKDCHPHHLAGPGASINGTQDELVGQRSPLLLLAVAAILLFWRLGAPSLWVGEGSGAEVVREMLPTGDSLHPTIAGGPCFERPPLAYWLGVTVSMIAGRLNELVVRLPSAVAGLVAVWATVKIGTRLWSAATGRIAGWFLLTTYAFLFWGRAGTPDAENLAFIMGAVAWYWSRRDHLTFPVMLVFYLIVFIGALAGGPTAVMVPILAVLPDMLTEKRWRVLLRPGHLLAFVIGLLIYLSPSAYASFAETSGHRFSDLGMAFRENILRHFMPVDHKDSVHPHAYELPVLLLPWTPLCLVATAGIMKRWKELDARTRWLIQALVLVLLFSVLCGSRGSCGILPILPLCSLLMAVFATWLRQPGVDGFRRWGLDIQGAVFVVLIAIELALPLILIIPSVIVDFKAPLDFQVAGLAVGVSAVLLGLIFRWLSHRSTSSKGPGETAWPMIAVAVVLLGGYFCWQQSALEVNRTERPFARQLRAEVAPFPPERIAVYPQSSGNLLFYLDTEEPVGILKNPDEVRGFIAQGRPGVVITRQECAAGLPANITGRMLGQRTLHEQVWRWESRSSKNAKWIAWLWEGSSPIIVPLDLNEGADDAR